ncbi:hypothetical protein BH20ACI1_BH20ACI1_01140 [soil metagenome]
MSKKNGNKAEEKIPTGKELLEMYPPPKKLTPEMKRLEESFENAMDALDRRIKEHGLPTRFSTLARSSNIETA